MSGRETAQPTIGELVDVAPFGEIRAWDAGKDIGILWEDARDIAKVVVRFANGEQIPDPVSVKLQYWQSQWPEHRVPREATGSDIPGWMNAGDWFQGKWKDADAEMAADQATWTFTFRPINAKEFPDLKDFDATYRHTLKLRLLFADKAPRIAAMRAFTDSTWQKTTAVVEWDKGQEWDGKAEAFNGHIARTSPLDGGSFALDFFYAKPAAAISYDQTVVTVRGRQHSFSFAARDIADGKRIFVRDYDVLVKPASDNTTYAQAEEAYKKAPRTVYDMVQDMPEQTFDRAWNALPKKKRIYIPLAVEGGRQHFKIQPNGDVEISRLWQTRVDGRDSPRARWKSPTLYVTFGLDKGASATGASIEDGVLPITQTWYERDGVRYTQDAFATTFTGKLPPGGRIKGDAAQVLMLRFRLTNLTREPKRAEFPISTMAGAKQESLYEKDGLIFCKDPKGDLPRLYVNTNSAARLTTDDKIVRCQFDLPPMAVQDVFAAISFETLSDPAEIAQLKSLDYDQQHKLIANHWRRRIAQGCGIVTPEPMINDFYAANITHQLINIENEIGAEDRAIAKVGTFYYGPYGNESTMMTAETNRRGFPEISEAVYQSWIHYQGTAPLPGDYTTAEGVYQGAGPYEEAGSGYNQNQGWVLWGMAEHYRLTGDSAWLDRVAPSLIKGCDWIAKQRARTSTDECVGIRAIERGLLPPGMLEDVVDWRSWLSQNVYSYWGLKAVGEVLAERKHPEVPRLLKEAADYGADILAAFNEAMVRTPVVQLRDGTWVPNIPSEVHRRGRSLGWISETLEGSILLIMTGLVEPRSQLADWILKDFEDNRFISDEYGYPMRFFERDWFSKGGLSTQANLLCTPNVYMMRDDIKSYLRAYFNAFSVGLFDERMMLAEQTMPDYTSFAGDHFKTSDEAMSTSWLRWMFIYEDDDGLYLGKAIPRYWLADGRQVKIERAETYFGRVSMSMVSNAANGTITMTIDPPTRNRPRAVYARFRHPDGKSMNRVTVDGKAWENFDPAKEWVILPPLDNRTIVIAYYD